MGSFADRSRGQLVAYAAAALLVVVAGVRFLDTGSEESAEDAPVAIEEAGATGEAGSGGGERVFVHVAGEVRRPGLYQLRAGERVGAAIDRAGGLEPRADLSAVNLAAELQDGQQVLVPKRGATTATAPSSTATTPSGVMEGEVPAAPISLAQATPEELDANVDGIGPVLAARIIEFRDEHGGVSDIAELEGVDGIGEERLADLRDSLVP